MSYIDDTIQDVKKHTCSQPILARIYNKTFGLIKKTLQSSCFLFAYSFSNTIPFERFKDNFGSCYHRMSFESTLIQPLSLMTTNNQCAMYQFSIARKLCQDQTTQSFEIKCDYYLDASIQCMNNLQKFQ